MTTDPQNRDPYSVALPRIRIAQRCDLSTISRMTGIDVRVLTAIEDGTHLPTIDEKKLISDKLRIAEPDILTLAKGDIQECLNSNDINVRMWAQHEVKKRRGPGAPTPP